MGGSRINTLIRLKNKKSIFLALGFWANLLVNTNAFASVVFQDTTNSPSNYTQVVNYAVGLSSASFGGSTSLQFSETQPPASTTNILLGVVNNSFVYNPLTQGAIGSISASVFKQLTVTNNTVSVGGNNGTVTFGSTFKALIDQGGKFYEATIPGTPVVALAGQTVAGATEHLSQSGLTASDFFSIDPLTGTFGTNHPNFTAGGTIDFGIVQLLSGDTLAGAISDVGSYTSLTIGVSSVPLPASLPLFGAALLGLGAIGYSLKQRKATA